METSPLLSHCSPTAIAAYRRGVAISAQRFITEATHLGRMLPAGRHVLNVCADRYRFTVGLAACLLTGRVSLLPSTHTPEVIRNLAAFAPDTVCLTDDAGCGIELPRIAYPECMPPQDLPWQVPHIPAAQLAAIVFTSGSTGVPLPYKKTWGRLARCIREGAARLGLADGRGYTVVGTVPPQHMYGLETTVLLPLLTGGAICAERPFFPGDVCASLAAAPRPRVLVSTPIHLRALLAAEFDLPPVDLVVSATAPLAAGLAREVEARFGCELLEIYGSTETGQIAGRRTAATAAWRLWPGVALSARNEQVFAHGGHVEQFTPLCDVVEIVDSQQFLLGERTADLVNIAGKRSSFGYLNAQLHAIAGVADGAFFLRDLGSAAPERLAAIVVAPGLSAEALMQQLRRRIDPVFLPRPLILVDQLPRNATGKLPQQALQSLARRHLQANAAP